jgi:hypothetical protein
VINGVLALVGGLTVETAIAAWVLGQALGVVILLVYVSRHTGFGRPDGRTARRQLSLERRPRAGRSWA